jgi:TPR repeat protein
MPVKIICCISLPPATRSSVPIYDFVTANEELADQDMEAYYPCCGKSICAGCAYSFDQCGNEDRCPFCNSDRANKTDEEDVEQIMKRAEANDPGAMCLLGNHYEHGLRGLQQDRTKSMALYVRAADIGWGKAHSLLADNYYEGRDLKKAKFQLEAGAMAGHEEARSKLGIIEADYGYME